MDKFNRGLSDKAIKVTVNIDQASFANAKRKAGTLGGKEEVKLSADVNMSSFARASALVSALSKEGDKMGSVFDRSNLSIGQWTGILAAASPVILDVTGAIGALTASLGAAVAGLGALAVGGAGAAATGFGGIAAIAIPAISSLKDLMTTQKAANKAQATGAAGAARSQTAAAQQIKTANQAVAQSEEQLKVAQTSEEIAQKALTQARKDAVRQLQDMKRAALESGTSEKRARLSILEAEANLRQLRASGTASTLDIRDAELSVTEARQNAKDVTIAANRAQQDYNTAQKKGIDQMPGVVSAQQSLDSATRGVTDAQTAVAKATQNLAFQQKQANTATQAGGTQMAALALAQKKAGPEAVKFAGALKDLSHRWRDLTKAGRADFFGMLSDGLGRVNQKLPMLAKSANTSMNVLRGGFDLFLKKATGPEFDHFIHVMTDTFAKSMKPIAGGFANIATVLERIAVAVAPDVLRMVRGFKSMTQDWVDSTRNAKDLRDTIHGLVNQANTWWKLIKATAGLIVAVLVPGMGQGKKAVEGITASLQEWTRWVNAHPREMRDFFKEALKTTGQLAQVLLGFIPTLFQISTAMRPIARAFLAILKGLNSLKLGNVTALTVLLGAMVGAKLVTGIAGLVKSINTIREAWLGVRAAATGAAAAEAGAGVAGGVGGVPLGAGTKATTVTGRTIGSTGEIAKSGSKVGAIMGRAAQFAFAGAFVAGLAGAIESEGGLKSLHFEGLIPKTAVDKSVVPEVIQGIIDKFGSLRKAAKFMDEDTKKHFLGLITSARDAGEITDRQWSRMTQTLGNTTIHWGKSMKRLQQSTGDAMKQIRQGSHDTINGMVNSVQNGTSAWDKSMQKLQESTKTHVHQLRESTVGSVNAMVHGVSRGYKSLQDNTNKALSALGTHKVKFGVDTTVNAAMHGQRGGHIPGAGEGDKVPAMLEPGEFVINKKAARVHRDTLEKMNFKDAPRFQGGGVVDRTGVQHLARGGLAAMIAEANRFESHHFPYVWGGGHGGFGVQPVDCSGAVSDILHAAGLLNAPMVSGDLARWGKPGKGQLTVYANPVHTFMSLAGKFFGTSSTNPGGGAGWMPDPGAGYRAGFAARTMPVTGAAFGQLKRIMLKGPKGALKDMGQGALDTTWKAAKRYINKQVPAGGFGGGQSLADFAKGPGKIVGASVYGFGEPGTGTVGASGVSLPGKPAFAELDMGTALGHLPFGKKLKITVGPHQAVGEKLDIGAGGGDVGGHHRAIDFWRDLAEKLGLSGSFLGLAKVQGLQKGGIAAPYVGSFDKGGQVASDGLGMLHKGETVVPGMQRGGLAPTFPSGLIKALRQLVHLTPAHDRQERRAEMHLLQRIARASGPRQLNLISKALEKFGVNFTKAEQKRLQKLARQQRHGGLTHPQHRELHHLRQERRASHEQAHIRRQIEVERELLTEFKQLRSELKEHNRLVKDVRVNEKAALNAVVNLTSSQIGAQGLQKTRNASPGRAARY